MKHPLIQGPYGTKRQDARPDYVPHYAVQCPKCKKWSGDDWSQCGGSCPMLGSPHFKEWLPDTSTSIGVGTSTCHDLAP